VSVWILVECQALLFRRSVSSGYGDASYAEVAAQKSLSAVDQVNAKVVSIIREIWRQLRKRTNFDYDALTCS